ncbi:LPS export ABC transporter ATP-binding protein [bacterium]|nr:LPS export ABC transporter ATP-binding protein [bacterium]|tara:strand:- start:1237 stop:1950 length:714 start_codon:yes stop_codon:yes gene_type:complete
MTKIESEGLVKKYGSRVVVNNVSISIPKGKAIGLLGPNGAGKTTTFYMITGLVKPDAGKVSLHGEDVSKFPVYKRARLGIGYLDQSPSVFRRLTVEENIRLVLEVNKIPKKEHKDRVDSLLEEMGIEHLKNSLGYALSGGERRRVEIARSIANNPDFILLDEPFTGVDPLHIQQLHEIIISLKEKRGLGVLITDHNHLAMLNIADWIYLMNEGKIEVQGTPDEIKKSNKAKEIYLGN